MGLLGFLLAGWSAACSSEAARPTFEPPLACLPQEETAEERVANWRWTAQGVLQQCAILAAPYHEDARRQRAAEVWESQIFQRTRLPGAPPPPDSS